MDTQVATAIASGIASLIGGILAIVIKEYLQKRELHQLIERDKPLDTNPVPQEVEKKGILRYSVVRPVTLLAIVFVLGIGTRLLRPLAESSGVHFESIGALAVLLTIAILILRQKRKRHEYGRILLFQIEMFILWFGFMFGWSIMHGEIWSAFIALIVMWWIGSGAVGGLILFFFPRKREAQQK